MGHYRREYRYRPAEGNEAWRDHKEAGAVARREGVPLGACPYPLERQPVAREAWEQGWIREHRFGWRPKKALPAKGDIVTEQELCEWARGNVDAGLHG